MIGYIARRLLALIPLLLIISFIVYGLVLLVPGDPARTIAGGTKAPEAKVEEVRHQLRLDEPFVTQWSHWLGDALHGDLGYSFYKNRPVASELADRFPVTLSLTLGAMVVTLVLGVPTGVAAGTRPGSRIDRVLTVVTSGGLAFPDFWLGMLLVVVFAVELHALPAIGYVPFTTSPIEWLTHLYLPCLALGIGNAATLARQLRGSLADAMDADYVRTARAKGLRRSVVVYKHALKNVSMAPVTVLGLQFAYLLGGTVLIEYIFSIPGIGQYIYSALLDKDIPVIQGVVLVFAVIFVIVNLAVDVFYGYLNPKVRVE